MAINPTAIARLGELRDDGGIRLFDLNRDYRRIRQSAHDVVYLHSMGFTEIMSSNVSAAKVDRKDLLIRFHNGSVYRYFRQAHLFKPLMESSSKGKFVHRRLKKTRVRYRKEGTLDVPSKFARKETAAEMDKRVKKEFKRYNIKVTDVNSQLINLALKQLNTAQFDLTNMTNILMSINLGAKIIVDRLKIG